MQRNLVALACALGLAAGSALAQPQGTDAKATADPSGPTMTDKARQAAQNLGEKARDAMGKVKELAQETADKSRADDTANPGRSAQSRKLQKQADADLQAARAKCDAIERDVQKTVCEKQAAVAHATAELRIAKAEAAAAGSKTATMGAGKAKP